MKIITLPLGQLQTNCYLVSDDSGLTAVIDPGAEAEHILEVCRKKALRIGAILLTHGHFDHVGAVRALAEATHCPVWMSEHDLRLPASMTAGPLYYTDGYSDGDTVSVGDLSFTVLETPGHTPGSVCLLCGDVLFSGDTLFAGSMGRTDFPLGSIMDMMTSLHRLAQLQETLQVRPGHGPSSTIKEERASNPYLRKML